MLTETFFKEICEGKSNDMFMFKTELTAEEQIKFIKKRLSYLRFKSLNKVKVLEEIINRYKNLNGKFPDKEKEFVINALTKHLDKISKKEILSYEDFFEYMINKYNAFENKYSLYNCMIYLLLNYEGITSADDFMKLSVKNFKIDMSKRNPKCWIEFDNKVVEIHRKTYDFIMDYTGECVLEYKDMSNNKVYKYYSYLTENENISPFRTKEEGKILNNWNSLLKSLGRFTENYFNLSATAAYNYGRFEVLFKLELLYENVENLSSKIPSKLFEYVARLWWGDGCKKKFSDYRIEYLAWREKKIKYLISLDNE